MLPREAIQMLHESRVYDLAREMFTGMPVFSPLPPFTMTSVSRHGDHVRSDGYTGSDEFIAMCNHCGTHLDALCHGSSEGRFFDGMEVVQTGAGFRVHGVETVGPIVRRGLLLDIPAVKKFDVLPPAYEVTVQDLEEVVAMQGTAIRKGDVVLVRTGWMRYWDNPRRYLGAEDPMGLPGPGLAAAKWLGGHGIWAGGSDTLTFEVRVPLADRLPVHKHFLTERGIFILEGVFLEDLAVDRVYEFLFVGAPLKFRGATGAPIRPLAFA